MSSITKFYVAYHDPEKLRSVEVPPDAIRVDLNQLRLPGRLGDPRIAESRLLLAMSLNPDAWIPATGYVALFHASYNDKFGILPPLVELPAILSKSLSPTAVIGTIMCPEYLDQAEQWYNGMGETLAGIIRSSGTKITDRPGPMTNSFVAHADVWRRFLSAWLRMYCLAIDQIDRPTYDTKICKPGIEPAYLLERFTTAWFAAQDDLQRYTIVGRDGAFYSPKWPGESVRSESDQDTVDPNPVRIFPPRA